MHRETLERPVCNGGSDVMAQSFSHDDEENRRERITLMNASGGGKRFRSKTIDQNG
jgi:hypothetical protein